MTHPEAESSPPVHNVTIGAPVPFVHYERVRFGDLDAMRHLNNVVFLRYFESARIRFMRG